MGSPVYLLFLLAIFLLLLGLSGAVPVAWNVGMLLLIGLGVRWVWRKVSNR